MHQFNDWTLAASGGAGMKLHRFYPQKGV